MLITVNNTLSNIAIKNAGNSIITPSTTIIPSIIINAGTNRCRTVVATITITVVVTTITMTTIAINTMMIIITCTRLLLLLLLTFFYECWYEY